MKHDESETVSDTLDLPTAYHSHNTRNMNLFRSPFPRVEAIRNGSNMWNSFLESVTVVESIRSFKRNLADYLIEKY